MTTSDNSNNNNKFCACNCNRFNYINLVAYLINVFVTFAIGQFGLGGRPTNGELSDKYQTIVTPVGLMFSIWGPIFILQALWVLWQFLLPSLRNSEGVYKVGYWYAVAVVFQCGWTFAFSWEVMWASLVCMYGICISLVMATLRLQTYQNKTWKGYLLWQLPISLHCGWIIAASAVNTNVLPVFYNANATVQIAVAGASLGVLVIVALAWLAAYPVDLAPPAVLVWALTGVYLALEDPADSIVALFSERQITATKYSVLGGLSLIGLGIVVKILYVLAVQRPAAAMKKNRSSSASSPAASAAVKKDGDSTSDEENPKAVTGLYDDEQSA
jgi:translocator protein